MIKNSHAPAAHLSGMNKDSATANTVAASAIIDVSNLSAGLPSDPINARYTRTTPKHARTSPTVISLLFRRSSNISSR
ncbi:MAG: hypothetical protein BWY28_02064 [bacterium ADurb.Bin236]|nr:MAG: hypothetical protein BWY28_02064 [bacterium ADurb.Bin236]